MEIAHHYSELIEPVHENNERPISESSPTDKLKKLMSLCKCEVWVQINSHRVFYDTAEEKIDAAFLDGDFPLGTESVVLKKMILSNTIIVCKFYTPVGWGEVWHYDIEKCLDEALEWAEGYKS